MGRLFEELGFMRWPMSFSVIAILLLTLWSARKLIGPRAVPDLRTKAWLDAILFWGGFAAISGVLSGLVGIITALQRIEAAGEVTTALVAFGYRVALSGSSLGLLILWFAALAWFPLQIRWRFLQARSSQGNQG